MRTTRRLLLGSALIALLPRWARGTTADDYCLGADEAAFLDLLNAYRAQNGRGPVEVSATLGAAAEHKALDMAASGNFTHTMSDGTTWLDNIINHGYPYGYRTENIAWGYDTPEQVMAAWQASADHNRNMLDGGFAACGIQRIEDATKPYRWFWVNTFGSQLDTPAAVCPFEPDPTPAPRPCHGRKCRDRNA